MLYVSEVDGNYYADGLDAWAVKWLMSSFGGRPNGGEYKLPQFYLLYKVHKPVLGFRPVTTNSERALRLCSSTWYSVCQQPTIPGR